MLRGGGCHILIWGLGTTWDMVLPGGSISAGIPRIIHKRLTSKIESITSFLFTLEEYILYCIHTGKNIIHPNFCNSISAKVRLFAFALSLRFQRSAIG